MRDRTVSIGLRGRKARQTWRAIYQAAWELASERGLANVSVELIAARANVAPRTVFNYFATKEDAVLGTGEIRIPEKAVESFLAGNGPLFDDIAELVFAVVKASRGDFPQIRALIEDSPSLFNHLRKDIHRVVDSVSDVVERRVVDPFRAEIAIATIGQLTALVMERQLRAKDDTDSKLLLVKAIADLREMLSEANLGQLTQRQDPAAIDYRR